MNNRWRHAARACLYGLFTWAGGISTVASADDAVTAVSAGPAIITISEVAAVVREPFTVTLSDTNSVIRISDLPREADFASLMLLDRRGELSLMEWQSPLRSPRKGMRSEISGNRVQISFESEPHDPSVVVQAVVKSLIPGPKKFDLVYVMTGLVWRASYDVLLRGNLADITSPMSIDVDGWIEISNASSRTFAKAAISVIGSDSLGEKPPAKEPGILELDDNSPLSDMWRYFPPEPKLPHIYTIKSPVTLPAGQAVLISHVSVARKPVDRILVFRAEAIPTDSRSRGAKPSQIIRFDNASDYGGNRSVPPGPALIHLGNQRSSLHQKAWFEHTPSQGEITVDMGKVDGILARRVDRGRVEIIGGGYEQVFEVRLDNQLEKPVTVILDEQPPISLAWSILRSNNTFEQRDRRLIFQPAIPARSNIVIQYTLRVTIPES
jgi:hypothetical protein